MTDGALLMDATRRILERMDRYEASESVANTGTGARREGEGFEHLVAELWVAFREAAQSNGAALTIVASEGRRRYARLTSDGRSLFVPASHSDEPTCRQLRWLEVAFGVPTLIDSYPGTGEAISRYAPSAGPFAGTDYPKMYGGLTTRFDDTVVLVANGVLHEKILLEYKTAKSSRGVQIDGNAHERLSFQIMQYLEVATRYTRCSFVVIANGAFARYRNKYHPNFHIQAERLRNFSWFSMEHTSAATEYFQFIEGLWSWLFDGTPRQAEAVR
ncbi:MAG: hypothetical protein KBC96_08145 [Armatimonadetes bacterium]|nr:hypothetical protein [Armatimonadota bacterium]